MTEVAEADYLHMVLKKTCWLATIHPSRMGALIGSMRVDGPRPLHPVRIFSGRRVPDSGRSAQSGGDPDAYGKELGGDIREGKRTLMLIHLWANSTDAERVRLREMLGQPRECRSEPDVTWVRERMDSYGCLDYARQVAQGLAGAARYEFTGLYGHLPDSMDRRFLEALPTWVIERN